MTVSPILTLKTPSATEAVVVPGEPDGHNFVPPPTVELSQIEKRDINGGNVPVASYLTDGQIRAAGNAIRTAAGFICGFLANLI